MPKTPSRLEQAVQATEGLSRVVREAHELLTDAKHVARELRKATAEARTVLAETAELEVERQVQAVVDESIQEVGAQTRKAMDEAVDKVHAEFDVEEFARRRSGA